MICFLFLRGEIEGYDSAQKLLPELVEVRTGLIGLSSIFNAGETDRGGLRFFFLTQQKWTVDMIDDFHIVCGRFAKKMKA